VLFLYPQCCQRRFFVFLPLLPFLCPASMIAPSRLPAEERQHSFSFVYLHGGLGILPLRLHPPSARGPLSRGGFFSLLKNQLRHKRTPHQHVASLRFLSRLTKVIFMSCFAILGCPEFNARQSCRMILFYTRLRSPFGSVVSLPPPTVQASFFATMTCSSLFLTGPYPSDYTMFRFNS